MHESNWNNMLKPFQHLQIIERLQRDLSHLNKEVLYRDNVIAEKEKRIMDFKRKTQVCKEKMHQLVVVH